MIYNNDVGLDSLHCKIGWILSRLLHYCIVVAALLYAMLATSTEQVFRTSLQSEPEHRTDAVHGFVLPSHSAAAICAAVPET